MQESPYLELCTVYGSYTKWYMWLESNNSAIRRIRWIWLEVFCLSRKLDKYFGRRPWVVISQVSDNILNQERQYSTMTIRIGPFSVHSLRSMDLMVQPFTRCNSCVVYSLVFVTVRTFCIYDTRDISTGDQIIFRNGLVTDIIFLLRLLPMLSGQKNNQLYKSNINKQWRAISGCTYMLLFFCSFFFLS